MLAVRRRVEHVDTDASGVVHFTRYPSLMETAVLENLAGRGIGADELGVEGLDLVLTDLSMRYLAPASFLDPLTAEVALAHLGFARFRMSGVVSREEDLRGTAKPLATGVLVFGVVDRASRTARALPECLRAVLRSS
jgi:acyl-CoA thioester hydrolase